MRSSFSTIGRQNNGTNVDLRLQPRGSRVLVTADIEVSNPADLKSILPGNPVLSQFRESVRTLVTPGQKATLCRYDEPSTGRQHEIELELRQLGR